MALIHSEYTGFNARLTTFISELQVIGGRGEDLFQNVLIMWVLVQPEEISFYVSCFLITALRPDSQMHTGIGMLHRRFKHSYVTPKSDIGGRMELNEEEAAAFFRGGCVFAFIFIKWKKALHGSLNKNRSSCLILVSTSLSEVREVFS